MKIKKSTTIIQVRDTALKQNIYSAYIDLLKDSFNDDLEYFEMDVNRLSDVIESIPKHGFTPLFKDGYTQMLLSSEDFQEVETFFHEHSNDDEELEVRIVNDAGVVIEVVKHDDLSY